MSITLGTVPERLSVVLSKDADFFSTLQNADGPWAETAQIELRFGTTVWSAVISGTDAVFNEDSVTVNQLIESKTRVVKLFFIDGPTEVCWGVGLVDRNG